MPSSLEKNNLSILLFDGFCILCSKFAQRLIKKVGSKVLVLPMQSEKGEYLLKKYHQSTLPNEVIFISNHRLIKGVKAILALMHISGGVWKWTSKLLSVLPTRLIDWFYKKIALNRYIWFGKRTTCYMGNG